MAEYEPEFDPGPWGSDFAENTHRAYAMNQSDLGNPDFEYLPEKLSAPWGHEDGYGINNTLTNGPEHPEFIGSQVIWYMINGGDVAIHANLFGIQPLGIEVRVTICGYNRPDAFGDMMFLRILSADINDDNLVDVLDILITIQTIIS